MEDSNTHLQDVNGLTRLDWGAIWAGMFTFFAIWAVFGALCLAIFANSANVGLAMSVWGTILTIIAMFFAGRTTGRLSGVTEFRAAIMPGTVMFGLAVTAALFVIALIFAAFGQTVGTGVGHGPLLGVFSEFGWALFVGLFSDSSPRWSAHPAHVNNFYTQRCGTKSGTPDS